jgi:hypothetical protein
MHNYITTACQANNDDQPQTGTDERIKIELQVFSFGRRGRKKEIVFVCASPRVSAVKKAVFQLKTDSRGLIYRTLPPSLLA